MMVSNNLNEIKSIETGFVNDSSGSCYLSINDRKVIATVKGPHMLQTFNNFQDDVEICNLDCEIKFLDSGKNGNNSSLSLSSSYSDSKQMSNSERQLSYQLKDALKSSIRLDLYPKATLSVTVIIISNNDENLSISSPTDGYDCLLNAILLSSAINSSSLALIDAGIELYDVVVSSIGCHRNQDGNANTNAVLLVAEMSKLQQLSYFLCEDASIDVSQLEKSISKLHNQCVSIRQVIDNHIKGHNTRKVK